MKSFETLAHRGIYYFTATMPPFRAAKSDSANEEEQETSYNFIKGIYAKLNDNPEFFGLKTHPDDSYQFWWSKRTEKPGLPDKIRSYIKNINLMMETVYIIISEGETDGDNITLTRDLCQIKPTMLKKLINLGIIAEKGAETYCFAFPKGTVKGLKLLASISSEHSHKSTSAIHIKSVSPFLLFSRGIFCPEAPYTAEIFREIFDNKESFDKLTDFINKEKFIRIDNKEYKTGIHGDTISLDYIKFYGKPEGVIGSSWKTKNFSGVEFSYDELNEDCTRIGVHVPYFREVLENVDKMSPNLREFISKWNKCMGCRYCVQMDKSKTKPLRFVKINESNVCSVFTFGYTFNQFYEGMWIADSIVELLEFVDELFADRRVEV